MIVNLDDTKISVTDITEKERKNIKNSVILGNMYYFDKLYEITIREFNVYLYLNETISPQIAILENVAIIAYESTIAIINLESGKLVLSKEYSDIFYDFIYLNNTKLVIVMETQVLMFDSTCLEFKHLKNTDIIVEWRFEKELKKIIISDINSKVYNILL